MHDPVTHQTDAALATVDTMSHHVLMVRPNEKFDVLAAIANRSGRTILFVRTQLAVDRLVGQLAEVGVRSAALHGGKTQAVRTRTLAEFREGRIDVLVATNVAARGIHVDGVDLVVHVDPPKDAKDYLHRAGRTARAGESGTVVTLVLPRQRGVTFSMLERAGVVPVRTEVSPHAAGLVEVTGARRPSGVPVPVHQPAAPAPAARGFRRDSRPARPFHGDKRHADKRHGDSGHAERYHGDKGHPRSRTPDHRPRRATAARA